MNGDFLGGFICGIGLMIAILFITLTFRHNSEYNGYKDKMVIEYHCPSKEYERKLFLDMVNGSGIQTNFVNKECFMGKYSIRYRMTNPE